MSGFGAAAKAPSGSSAGGVCCNQSMTLITIEIPPGPDARFSEDVKLPERLPIHLGDGSPEPQMALVVASEVLPHAIRVTLDVELPPALAEFITAPLEGLSIARAA